MNADVWQPGATLQWRQPGRAKEGYVLTTGTEEAARFTVTSWHVANARGESALGSWIFSKEGFWDSRYFIREEATHVDVAEFFPKWHWSSGRIQFTNGKEFAWKISGVFSRYHTIATLTGANVLVLREGLGESFWRDLFRQQGRIEVGEAEKDPKTLSILAMFAWHLALMTHQRRASAAGG
ncbi:MAG: hypothetical protein AB1428_14580 [Bacteroidota bacterium]